MFGKVIQPGTNIVAFSTTLIVLTSALTNAAKVNSQHSQTSVIQRGSGTKHNFIVHRAASKRMWM
jgi:hypothetical protein